MSNATAAFGMNFQAVSVGQKLIKTHVSLTGGYLDAQGTPTPLLVGEIEFAEQQLHHGERVCGPCSGIADSNNVAGIGQIFWGPGITVLYNAPGLPPEGDPRTPDILVTPNIGVTYSGSGKKLAEHGGFAHDDTNVLLSHPSFQAKTIPSPVETMQVAPTILKALGFDPSALQSVQEEGTQVLDGVF